VNFLPFLFDHISPSALGLLSIFIS